ncbi:hypothetical protein I3I95_07090 [bacterium]|nr:hypothetical protein [bacterium]
MSETTMRQTDDDRDDAMAMAMATTAERMAKVAAPITAAEATAPATAGAPDGMASPAEAAEGQDPAEAIRSLLGHMAARREVLLGIVDFCREPRTVADVEARVRELQARNVSVYSAAALCAMLEEAGALVRESGGERITGERQFAPNVEVVDGVEYLRPRRMPATTWLATEAGTRVLGEDDPLSRFRAMIDEERVYMPIYLRVLELCDRDNGASAKELGEAVDHEPLVQNPRLFAQHFVERLERCDVLSWDGGWRVTDLGRGAREELALMVADR